MSHSCDAIFHSRSFSSHRRRLLACASVIRSTAFRYSSATLNIRYVEFHRVHTSRGNFFSWSLTDATALVHAGRGSVGDRWIAIDIFLSWPHNMVSCIVTKWYKC